MDSKLQAEITSADILDQSNWKIHYYQTIRDTTKHYHNCVHFPRSDYNHHPNDETINNRQFLKQNARSSDKSQC